MNIVGVSILQLEDVMLKEIKYLIFHSNYYMSFIFFTGKYYFSDENIKKFLQIIQKYK